MWTYGAELELADIDRSKKLPEGFGWDVRDYSMVNSNGIAVDPKALLYGFGGEVNLPPADSIEQQVENFCKVFALFPEAAVNYRSNLHIHISVPGLKDDLKALKRLQVYVHDQLKPFISKIEPIPVPVRSDYKSNAAFEGANWRYKRRKKSHQTFLTPKRIAHQLQAETVQEFLEREVPRASNGNVMWHAQARCCVNIRQLRETNTIEFRHFPGTLSEQEFFGATQWCYQFMLAALITDEPIASVWKRFSKEYTLPKFEPYKHELEVRYALTCADGTVAKKERIENIERLLGEINEKENTRRLSRSDKS